MAVDKNLLRDARAAADQWADALEQAELAKEDYHQAVRRLHLAGASLWEIADALGLSHQRVHQMIEEAGGTAGWKPRSRVGSCSFCGAQPAEVSSLVAGPAVFICDRCVAAEHGWRSGGDCSFCERTEVRVVTGENGRICEGCLSFCAEVIAARQDQLL